MKIEEAIVSFFFQSQVEDDYNNFNAIAAQASASARAWWWFRRE